MNVLVVAAHPDDEIIGVGGTLAKHVQAGDNVYALILGDGKSSRKESYEVLDAHTLSLSHQETERAKNTIGLQLVDRHDLPDNRFDSMDLLDIVKAVNKYVTKIQPETVYTHFGGDINIDHSITFRAVMTATRPLPGCSVKRVFAFETLSSTEWNFDTAFRPNYFVDISEHLEKKLEAMAQYQSELRDFPHPRSLEALRYNAKVWGARAGFMAAEPFILVRGLD